MSWYIIGPEGQTTPELEIGEYSIHRVHDNVNLRSINLDSDFQIADYHPSTSRNHLKILVGEKNLFLNDLNSTHGSYLNGEKFSNRVLSDKGEFKLKLSNAEYTLVNDGKLKLNLGFLASHNGSNVEAILENIDKGNLVASPKVVISNNPGAKVLERAWDRGIPQYCVNRKNFQSFGKFTTPDQAIYNLLKKHNVNLVVCAGYMRPVGDEILKPYKNRVINIHPSLLPKHGGKGMFDKFVHQSVIDSNDQETGATVHLINSNAIGIDHGTDGVHSVDGGFNNFDDYDKGRILMQYQVPRFKNDTLITLSSRVLSVEHALYSQVLKEIQLGNINLDD